MGEGLGGERPTGQNCGGARGSARRSESAASAAARTSAPPRTCAAARGRTHGRSARAPPRRAAAGSKRNGRSAAGPPPRAVAARRDGGLRLVTRAPGPARRTSSWSDVGPVSGAARPRGAADPARALRALREQRARGSCAASPPRLAGHGAAPSDAPRRVRGGPFLNQGRAVDFEQRGGERSRGAVRSGGCAPRWEPEGGG